VPAGTQRDADVLEPQVLAWLRTRYPDRDDLRIESLRHASAGLSNETVLVDASWDGRRRTEAWALRLPAEQMTFPDFDLTVQARVQETVAAAGLPTPAPVVVELDTAWLGVPFLAMPFVPGHVGPQAAAFDSWIASLAPLQRRRLCDAFVDLLAGLHRVDTASTGLDHLLRGAGCSIADELAWWDEYLRWACKEEETPTAVIELLAWCRANLPTTEPPPSLLWGDPRLGNAIFDDNEQIVAALDWDMAFLGPAEHDVGWYLGLEEVTNRIAGRPVDGFPDRKDVVARYGERLGRPLIDFEWYEIFALARSVAITVRQIRIARQAGVEYLVPPPDRNPVVPYARELMARAG
jgi:aminoglycoside phosphotransferase (APT) family kinase protein